MRVSQLMSQRKYEEALALFDKIDSPDAESTEIQLIKASVFNAAGQIASARSIAEQVISRQPNNIEALLILASCAAVEGKDRDQRNFLERVIKAEPKNTKALCDLGYMALRAQSVRSAASYFDQALAADSVNGDALVGRAITYRHSREPKKAELLLNKAITLFPDWASPLNERARLYKGAGYSREALADLDKAKILEPDNYWISVDRGMTLVELDRRKDALEEFSRAIAIDPNNFLAYVYSAGIKDDLGDHAGSEKDYEILVKLNPEYYFGFEGLGLIKMRAQKWAEARDAFLEVYKKAPKEYSYALLATINWMRAGRLNDPKQFLAQVLRTVPRESVEWYILRLFHDLTGDSEAAMRIDRERNTENKARMLFYLANYYDIRGNTNLADKYFLQVQELDCRTIPEWRINEWFVAQRGLKLF
jgi:tetratricopeptide (TPR) repeat protein